MQIDHLRIQRVHENGMPPKVASVLTTKSLLGGRQISMDTAMPIMGSILSFVNAGFFFGHAYTLVKDWGKIPNKATHLSATAAHGALATTGLITLTTKVKAVSKVLGVHKTQAAMTAGKAAAFLGPIGLGIFAALSLHTAMKEVVQAVKETDPIKRKAHIYKALKHFLLSLALIFGALLMKGILSTPFGWAAVALILVVILLNIDSIKRKILTSESPAPEIAARPVTGPIEESENRAPIPRTVRFLMYGEKGLSKKYIPSSRVPKRMSSLD